MRALIFVLTILLFEPIIIDQQAYNEIMNAAHSDMRGKEFDIFRAILGQLEQRAVQEKAKTEQDKTKEQTQIWKQKNEPVPPANPGTPIPADPDK